MKKVVLNIGLNNNPKTEKEIVNMFQTRLSPKVTWAKVVSTYNDQVEPTLVLHGQSALAFKQITDAIKQLSKDLDQECIGTEVDDQGLLIYSPEFKGERYKFDRKYFRKIIA